MQTTKEQKETTTNVNEIPIVKYNLELNPKENHVKAANAFLNGKVGQFGKYYAVPNALVYKTLVTSSYGEVQDVRMNVIARKIETNDKTFLIGNSSVLPLIGRTVSFGNERVNRQVTPVQEYLSSRIQMIPFSVFIEANLDLTKYRLLDRGKEETVTRQVPNPEYDSWVKREVENEGKTYNNPEFIDETVHFTGASLFDVDGSTFLFDIDRIEIDHKIFNPFLVKIPVKVETIDQAYKALKPQEVIDAEEMGLNVERQGEWFFIPVSDVKAQKMLNVMDPRDVFIGELNSDGELDRYRSKTYTLRAGPNRPNYAQKGFTYHKVAYVSGLVCHSGREHRNVTLKGWFKAIPNTAIESFTIRGDVD